MRRGGITHEVCVFGPAHAGFKSGHALNEIRLKVGDGPKGSNRAIGTAAYAA